MDKITIEETYVHTYHTKFIVDLDVNFSRLRDLTIHSYERVFFVYDKNVEVLYRKKIEKALNINEKECLIFSVYPDEYSKTIDYYPQLVEFLSMNNAGRYDAVVVIGGGILIDLVSFTVSTYMRGLPFFVIATTLIGQTDASTAGKTCLNAGNAKNLLGTFYYPIEVYNNISTLSTCSSRIMRQGLSEAFKYSLLTDGEILPHIIEYNSEHEKTEENLFEIVEKTIRARIAIRRIDPLASNLGHTFGHALEKYFDYNILHGDAIFIGMVMAINYGVYKGIMKKSECDIIFSLMKKAKLNIWIDSELDIEKLVELMKKDKKSSSKKLHLVMIKSIGQPYNYNGSPFFEADYQDVCMFLKNFCENYQYKKKNLSAFLMEENLND